MKEIFETAASISSPIALGGLFAVIIFFVIRQLISSGIFPGLTRRDGADVVKMIIDRLFWLALVATVLGALTYALLVIVVGVDPEKPQLSFTEKPPSIIGIYPNDIFGINQQRGFIAGHERFCSPYQVSISHVNPISYKEMKDGKISLLTNELVDLLKGGNILGISGPSITEVTPEVMQLNLEASGAPIFVTSAASRSYLNWSSYRKSNPIYRISSGVDDRGKDIASLLTSVISSGKTIGFLVENSTVAGRKSFGEVFFENIVNAHQNFNLHVNAGRILVSKFDRGSILSSSSVPLVDLIAISDVIFYLGVGGDLNVLASEYWNNSNDGVPNLVTWMHAHATSEMLKDGRYDGDKIFEITDITDETPLNRTETELFFINEFGSKGPDKRDEAFSFDTALVLCKAYGELVSRNTPPSGKFIKIDSVAIEKIQKIIESNQYDGASGSIALNRRGLNSKGHLVMMQRLADEDWKKVSKAELGSSS